MSALADRNTNVQTASNIQQHDKHTANGEENAANKSLEQRIAEANRYCMSYSYKKPRPDTWQQPIWHIRQPIRCDSQSRKPETGRLQAAADQ